MPSYDIAFIGGMVDGLFYLGYPKVYGEQFVALTFVAFLFTQ